MEKNYFELKHDRLEHFGELLISFDDYEMRDGHDPELIQRFESKEEAFKELAKYKCSYYTINYSYPSKLTLSDWYYIEEVIYDVDEEGNMEWSDSQGMDFAEMEAVERTQEEMDDLMWSDKISRKKYKK